VMGEYIYSAQDDKPDDKDLTSDEALANPYYRQVVVAPDLLGIPPLRGIITDTHFDTRKREGRLLTFMGRILEDRKAERVRGIGVDEKTALLVEPDGMAHVVGKGEADFFEADRESTQCRAGVPLSLGPIAEKRVLTGKSFNVAGWKGESVDTTLSVDAGKILQESVR
jgi:cyanophycinase